MSMEDERRNLLGANGKGNDAANVANKAGDMARDYVAALQQELAQSNQPEAAPILAAANKAVEEIMMGAVRLVDVICDVEALAAKQ